MNVSLQDFVADLRQIPPERFAEVQYIKSFLVTHPIDPSTLQSHLFWDRQHYTRNLIDKTSVYELLAICWDIGQSSSIHNHQGQNCWMAVPVGRLIVENYRVLASDSNASLCNLVKTDMTVMDTANPVAVNPEFPVHRVFNSAVFENRAVSVHVYSLPFDRCTVYSDDLAKFEEIHLSYTTEYGERK
jgi:cysteine dioxygenase